MTIDKHNLAWNLFVESRRDILEFQKLRAQIVGFKITFVSAGIGLIAANSDKIPSILLVVPAFAAIFFDFLLAGYSFSIKRSGYYCRKYIEPVIRELFEWPNDFLLWEEFMSKPEAKQKLPLFSILGITILAIAPAIIALLFPYRLVLSTSLIALLLLFFVFDIYMFLVPNIKYGNTKFEISNERQPQKSLSGLTTESK